MAWRAQNGGTVMYRNAAGKIKHATITNVDSQTQLDLRVGGATHGTAYANVLRADNTNTVNRWFKARHYPRPRTLVFTATWGSPTATVS
jgi:hypothetical protein